MTQKARNNLMRGLLLFGSVLILVGVFLTWWMLATEEDSSVIEIRLDYESSHTVEFDHLGLVPGWETRYSVDFLQSRADRYSLHVDFVPKDGGGELPKYARVKILSGETEVYDELLADAFRHPSLILPVDFGTGANTSLTVVYYLPEDVGNEAKLAEAFFEVRFSAGTK